MRVLSVALLIVVAFGSHSAAHAQLSDPIPTPIAKRGLRVEIKDVVRLPDTRGLRGATEDAMPALGASEFHSRVARRLSETARRGLIRDLP